MITASQTLAKFAADLKFSDIPRAVIERAKDCIIDSTAAATFGAQLPWGQMVRHYACRYGSGGPCAVIGSAGVRVHAPYAALANGVLAHAFELDCSFERVSGTHPGSTLMPAILAASEEVNADGKTALVAFVVGCELLYRVGGASFFSRVPPEALGFHQPGLTGPYGAAIAAGIIFGLNAEQLAHALGIAGSLSSGLIACTKSKQGGMVKPLHLGRSAESGILAARLASSGYTGPETVLEGRFGFLDAYCREAAPERLTAGLGTDWGTLRLCMKRYPIHMSSHTAVQSLRELMSEHAFQGPDVASITVEVAAEKTLHHNNITEPGDMMQAQYSMPFCVALALYRDPEDPNSFNTSALQDTAIRAACRNVQLCRLENGGPKSLRIIVHLKNGRHYDRAADSFKGMPDSPFSRAELRHKFMLQAAAMGDKAAAQLFGQLDTLEAQPSFSLAPPIG